MSHEVLVCRLNCWVLAGAEKDRDEPGLAGLKSALLAKQQTRITIQESSS